MTHHKETLILDEAFTRADPAAIKAAGYVGVIGYVSTDAEKNMTIARVRALHAQGLAVGLVWETTADRATKGHAAGVEDRKEAERDAKALGYPPVCILPYACDEDADPAAVEPYYAGVHEGATNPSGPYGSLRVIEAITAHHDAGVTWQTQAWSGKVVSPDADLYQRVGKTLPHVKGVPSGSYDEDVVLKPVRMWGPRGVVVIKPPAPKPAETGKPLSPVTRALITTVITVARRLIKRLTQRVEHGKQINQAGRDRLQQMDRAVLDLHAIEVKAFNHK